MSRVMPKRRPALQPASESTDPVTGAETIGGYRRRGILPKHLRLDERERQKLKEVVFSRQPRTI